MKKIIIASLSLGTIFSLGTDHAAALSCLPTEMYLEEVIGNEEIVIFEATSLDRIEEKAHTVEVLKVTEAKQGWVEDKLFVYHEKHDDWGYLCNNGPQAEGSTGLYVAVRNDQGQYSVYQRLDLTDPLIPNFEANLEEAEIEGSVSEVSSQDRMNQILTSIRELIAKIHTLFAEYTYWKSH